MVTHVVQPGESVYSIAEQLAGANAGSVMSIAGSIVDANLDATMGPGKRFTTAAYIEAGWVLQIPAHLVTTPVVQPAEATPPSEANTYTVQRGDTLWDIADEQLGDPTAWPEIWEDNAGDDMGGGRTFDDPDLILPGWELDLPGADPAEVANTPADARAGRRTTRRRRATRRHRPVEVVAPPEVVATTDRCDRDRAITGRDNAGNHRRHRPSEHRPAEHDQHRPGRGRWRRRSGRRPGTRGVARGAVAAADGACGTSRCRRAGAGRGSAPPTVAGGHATPSGARASTGSRRDRASTAGHRRRRAGTACRCRLPRRRMVAHRHRVADRVGRGDVRRRRRAAAVCSGRSAGAMDGRRSRLVVGRRCSGRAVERRCPPGRHAVRGARPTRGHGRRCRRPDRRRGVRDAGGRGSA